ncbi:hypothetical protein ONE63_003516 [Megalurothrips usitatus]|uniref:Uncharacterized protein n=1 Tax=Megalurothrips usitatus TaxID=439358 RepID=A0AAV7X771_9NEOP|nr:hypothetical protein ONE63_003516 [Megalurothrips usitatus]
MMNMLCSPELSFNSKVENQPTAYVSYSDEEKDIVPVHFIYKFPEDWRRKKWRTNYLFKVFWSPIPDDSPSKMLQRVPTIPVFEKGAARNHAGYHRAAVLLVKESEAELLQALETGKRISVGLTKYKFTSFDEGKSKSQAMAHDKVQQQRNAAPALKKNGKPVVLKNKVKDSNTKVKAKVKKADQPATTKLRESLKRRYVESSDKDGTEDSHLGTLDFKVAIKESEKAPARSSEDAKSKRSKGELASISERAVKFGSEKEKSAAAAIELQSGLDKDIKSNEIFDKVETVTIEETAVTPTKNGLFASPSKDMSFSDEKSNQLSRDYDARSKHANESLGDLNVGLKAEDGLLFSFMSDSDIEKGSDSNQIPGGEDDSSDKEDDDDDDLNSTAPIEPLPVIITQTSADRLNCSSRRSVVRQVFPDSDITSTDSDDKKTLKLDPDYTPRKYVRAKEDLSIQRTTIKRLSTLNLKHQEKILELEGENEKLTSSLQRVQAEFEKFKAKCKCSKQGTSYHPASNPHPNVVSKTVPDSVKPHSKFKDDRKSSHGGSKINKITLIKVKKENSDSSSDDDKEDINGKCMSHELNFEVFTLNSFL